MIRLILCPDELLVRYHNALVYRCVYGPIFSVLWAQFEFLLWGYIYLRLHVTEAAPASLIIWKPGRHEKCGPVSVINLEPPAGPGTHALPLHQPGALPARVMAGPSLILPAVSQLLLA